MTDLIDWLRQQIAGDAEQWRLILSGPRKNGKGIARDRLAHCEAHALLVEDAAELLALPITTPYEQGRHDVKRNDLKLIGLAYRHRPGYLDEWRP